MALNGAKINCWVQHERSLPKKARRALKGTNAPRGRLLHSQPPGKVMASNVDCPLVSALDCAGHSGPEFQVLFYFLAETFRLKI